MRLRALGLLLFLPIPLVLWLLTSQALGVGWSVAIAVALMVTHRLYARPFALRHAHRRCLWCGGRAAEIEIEANEPGTSTLWRACSPPHTDAQRRVLGWMEQRSTFLRIGVLGTLVLFLVALLVSGLGGLGSWRAADTVSFFRIGIALTVLPLGWLATSSCPERAGSARLPFPVHIQALIGTWSVLWLFRLVGLAWLVLGLVHAYQRLIA
jgi:hypothetical protein